MKFEQGLCLLLAFFFISTFHFTIFQRYFHNEHECVSNEKEFKVTNRRFVNGFHVFENAEKQSVLEIGLPLTCYKPFSNTFKPFSNIFKHPKAKVTTEGGAHVARERGLFYFRGSIHSIITFKNVSFRAPGWLSRLSIRLSVGSGPDLRAPEFEPCIGLWAVSAEPAWDSPSLPLSLPPPSFTLSLSLSLKINKLRKFFKIFLCIAY